MYRKGDKSIAIMNDPYHKRKGLYIGKGNVFCRIATFNSDEDARKFDAVLTEFFEPLLNTTWDFETEEEAVEAWNRRATI